MPIRIVPIIPLSTLAAQVARVNSALPATKRVILKEAGEAFVDNAKEHVHFISGRTRNSIRIARSTSSDLEIEAGFGALSEIRRGGNKPPPFRGLGKGPHNFTIAASKETARQFPMIVKKHIDSLFRKG